MLQIILFEVMKYDYISFMSASQILAASVLTISSTLSGFIPGNGILFSILSRISLLLCCLDNIHWMLEPVMKNPYQSEIHMNVAANDMMKKSLI